MSSVACCIDLYYNGRDTRGTRAFVIPYLAKSGRLHPTPYLANCSMPPSLPRGISRFDLMEYLSLSLSPSPSLCYARGRIHARISCVQCDERRRMNAFHEGVVREIALIVPVHHRRSVSSCRAASSAALLFVRDGPLSFRKTCVCLA